MESWSERPCGPLSLTIGVYTIVAVDLLFPIGSLTIHTIELFSCNDERPNKKSDHSITCAFPISYICIESVLLLLAALLAFGVLKRNLGKCQMYMFGSMMILLGGWVLYILYQIHNRNKTSYHYLFETICYPLYTLYKLYALWIVRCYIIGLIREKRSNSLVIKRNSGSKKRPDYYVDSNGSSGVGTSHIPSTESPRFGRQTSPDNYDRLNGIDDIFQQIQFPKDDHIPLEQFKIESEMLKMEDDFYVKKGQLQLATGQFRQIAVKIFKQKMEVESVRLMLLETKILTMFRNHNNVIQLLGFCTENIHKGKLILLLEFCEKGTLEDFLKENYPYFQDQIHEDEFSCTADSIHSIEEEENIYQNVMLKSDADIKFSSRTLIYWAYQIANGMEFILNKDIIHGNITAKNMIVDNHTRIKIGNFSFATELYHYKKTGTPINFTRIQGQLPYRWMAIECMEELIESNFTEKSDVWAFGVLAWELFSLGCVPYEGMNSSEFFPKLINGYRLEKPVFATSRIYHILNKCWDRNPNLRPVFTDLKSTFSEIIQKLG